MGKDAKEVEKRITTLYLIQKSSHDSVIKASSMQYHSMNRVAIAACIMETNIAIMICKTKNVCQSGFDVRAVLRKGNFNIPSAKEWNRQVCASHQHLPLNKRFALFAWICTCSYPTSFMILMASTRC